MLSYPHFDPIIFRLGPLAVRWYGLMYLCGFLGGYLYINYMVRLRNFALSKDDVGDLIFQCVIGVVVGGRLGYVLFYNLPYFLANPLQVFAVWEGGMSFHGGFLGVFVAGMIFCWRRKLSQLMVGDLLAGAAPIGLFFGRIGNFINAELWGRTTTVSWGMVFPGAGPVPRHPSQLYEAFFEGVLLFLLLWWFHRRHVPLGFVCFAFLFGYGLCRFGIEFFRQPDAHLGLLTAGLSMGQWLSLPMVLTGVAGIYYVCQRGGKKCL